MTNTLNQEQRDIDRHLRLTWLDSHPELLSRLPGASRTIRTPADAQLLCVTVDRMIRAGFWSPTNDMRAMVWSLRCLVSELRHEPIDRYLRHERR